MLILTPWRTTLVEALQQARREVLIVSPFIKTAIAANVVAAVDRPGVVVRTLTRFKAEDFACGVSDLNAAWMLSSHVKGRSAELEVRTDNKLHAKIYLIDGEVAFIGSSNLTLSGLMRNYEATVQTSDPTVLSGLKQEIARYWESRRAPAEADFSAMLDRLRRRGRTAPPEDEHIYDVSAPLNLFQPETAQDASQTWIEAQPASAPIERLTSRLEATSLLILPMSEPEGQRHAVVPVAAPEEILAGIDARVGEFLDALERMGVPARRRPGIYGPLIRHPSIKVLGAHLAKAGLSSANIEPATFFTAPFPEPTTGHAVYSVAGFMIATRAGILQRFGRAGMSAMLSAARRNRVTTTLWNENFLGPLLADRSVQSLSSHQYELAGERLFGAIALTEGLEAATRFIEHHFNPLDILGSDMGSILAFKDAKTSLQNVAQAHGLRPIYSNYANDGSDHETAWRCEVSIGKVLRAQGVGNKKSDAEHDAAEKALAQARRHPTYASTIQQELGRGLTTARVRDFLLPLQTLDPRQEAMTRRAYRSVLGCEIDPLLGYSALVDVETRSKRGLLGNNQALTTFGRALTNYGLLRRQVQVGLPFLNPTTSRALTDELALDLQTEPLRKAAGFFNPISRQTLVDTSVAVVAAVCLHHGYDAGLDILSRAFDQHLGRLSRLQGATEDGDLFTRLYRLGAEFNATASYVQLLQELTQAVDVTIPSYQSRMEGPAHAPTAISDVTWRRWRDRGTGATKALSRQRAAFGLLTQIKPSINELKEEAARRRTKKDEEPSEELATPPE